MRCGHTNALGIAASKISAPRRISHQLLGEKNGIRSRASDNFFRWSRPLVSFFSTAITSHLDVKRHSDRKELPERSLILLVDNYPPFARMLYPTEYSAQG